jgi:hypothetical protein
MKPAIIGTRKGCAIALAAAGWAPPSMMRPPGVIFFDI